MKKEIKVNFKYFWPGFDPKNNFFTNLLKENYSVKISNKPDYLFFSVYNNDATSRNTKLSEKYLQNRITLAKEFFDDHFPKLYGLLKDNLHKKKNYKIQEPEGSGIKIFYTAENVTPNMEKCDWAFSYEYDEDFKHPNHLRLPYYTYASKSWGKELIKLNPVTQQKDKFCNFVYSAQNTHRENFFRALSKYKPIDSPGKRLNNMAPIGSHTSTNNSRSTILWGEEKINFLQDYKFTISFENTSHAGYTTEKIYHPMLANSIPIYWGNQTIDRDFNSKSFINLAKYQSTKDCIEHIIQLDQDPQMYKALLEEPWFKNNKPTKYFNKSRYLDRLFEIIETH